MEGLAVMCQPIAVVQCNLSPRSPCFPILHRSYLNLRIYIEREREREREKCCVVENQLLLGSRERKGKGRDRMGEGGEPALTFIGQVNCKIFGNGRRVKGYVEGWLGEKDGLKD